MLIYFKGLYDSTPNYKTNKEVNYIENLQNNEMQKGSIRYRDKQKIYEGRYRINGQQKSIYAKTKKECLLKLKQALKIKETTETTTKKYKLYEWLNDWFEIYKKPNLKENSLYQIKICIEKHIKQNINNNLLSNITAMQINIALNKIQSSRMKKYTYDVYCECLKQAFKNKLIKNNISEDITPIKHNRKIGKALTIEEQNIFINKIKNTKYENIFLFYLNSGLRKNELLNLKWKDINFKENTIFINGTKTIHSKRTIPLFNNLLIILNKLNKTNENVFNISADRLQKVFNKIKNELNFDITIHSLRHTFATRCLENNINIKTVQKWLGHAKMETTASIYTHVLSDYEKEQSTLFNLYPHLYPQNDINTKE